MRDVSHRQAISNQGYSHAPRVLRRSRQNCSEFFVDRKAVITNLDWTAATVILHHPPDWRECNANGASAMQQRTPANGQWHSARLVCNGASGMQASEARARAPRK